MLISYKSTIKKKVISLHLRLHQNKQMRKGMHTQTVLGLVKILPLTMFRPLWSSAGHQFLWAETRHWCLVFLVFDICRPESLRVLTTSCKYLSLARLDVFNLRYSSLNFLLLVFLALWCALISLLICLFRWVSIFIASLMTSILALFRKISLRWCFNLTGSTPA